MYMQTQELGGLKKAFKKVKKVAAKAVKVAVPLAAGAGGAVLGFKTGQTLVKAVSGKKSSGDAMRSAKEAGGIPYESMSAAQLQAEKSRLEGKFAAGQVKGKDVALGQQRLANINTLLSQTGTNAADQVPPVEVSKSPTVKQPKPRPRRAFSTSAPAPAAMPASISEPAPFIPSSFAASSPRTFDENYTELPEVTVEGKRDYTLLAVLGIGALAVMSRKK